MKFDLDQVCDLHPNRFNCPDALMYTYDNGRYGLIVHDGSESFIKIAFCPWCGTKLNSESEDA